MNRFALILLAGSAAFAGSLFPTMALVVNDKDNEKRVDPKANGYLAFAARTSLDEPVKVDLDRIGDGETFRIVLNPSFENSVSFSIGTAVLSEKKFERDVVSRSVVLEQLPVGKYVTKHFYFGQKSGGAAMRPDTVTIEAGRVASLGSLELACERNFLQLIKTFKVETKDALPDSLLVPFGRLGIDVAKPVPKSIQWGPK